MVWKNSFRFSGLILTFVVLTTMLINLIRRPIHSEMQYWEPCLTSITLLCSWLCLQCKTRALTSVITRLTKFIEEMIRLNEATLSFVCPPLDHQSTVGYRSSAVLSRRWPGGEMEVCKSHESSQAGKKRKSSTRQCEDCSSPTHLFGSQPRQHGEIGWTWSICRGWEFRSCKILAKEEDCWLLQSLWSLMKCESEVGFVRPALSIRFRNSTR